MSTNKHKEKISAFLDNELHRDEVMSFSLSSEHEDAKTIQRYQIMGDALRGEVSEASFIDVSRAVHNALEGESLAAGNDTQPVSDPTGSHSKGLSLSAWFRPVAGMAVAASVALVMVVTLSGQENPSRLPVATNTEQLPAVKSTPVMQLAKDDKVTESKTRDLDPRLVHRHLEFATQDALQGRLPYVRAVSYQKTQ